MARSFFEKICYNPLSYEELVSRPFPEFENNNPNSFILTGNTGCFLSLPIRSICCYRKGPSGMGEAFLRFCLSDKLLCSCRYFYLDSLNANSKSFPKDRVSMYTREIDTFFGDAAALHGCSVRIEARRQVYYPRVSMEFFLAPLL